jgi:hypothetical protein
MDHSLLHAIQYIIANFSISISPFHSAIGDLSAYYMERKIESCLRLLSPAAMFKDFGKLVTDYNEEVQAQFAARAKGKLAALELSFSQARAAEAANGWTAEERQRSENHRASTRAWEQFELETEWKRVQKDEILQPFDPLTTIHCLKLAREDVHTIANILFGGGSLSLE